jgi:hypothetical protein
MSRISVRLLSLAALLVASVPLTAGQRPSAGAGSQAVLRRDVEAMSTRLAGRMTPQQVVADAERLGAGYRALGPHVRGFGPRDYAMNREIARRSLDWLSRASLVYGRDPYVGRAFLLSYGTIGSFYHDYGPFYHPAAFVAYAGAARIARRFILQGGNVGWYEGELDRYALAYGAVAAYHHAYLAPWNVPQDLPQEAPVTLEPVVVPAPVPLPALDMSGLDAAQRAAWSEVRDRFRSVSPRVHQARVLLNELSTRLQRQQMTLNASDAANALKMQGYLEDAAELIKEKRFDIAMEALAKADYVRGKLRSVTGQ